MATSCEYEEIESWGMRKRWILVALAVGLLAAAITGGVALAWGGAGHGHGWGWAWGRGDHDERRSAVAAKVAGILGTDEQETADAIQLATLEVREEAADAALQDVAGRVAETLGTDVDATADAIEKVHGEMFTEAQEEKLQNAIDAGHITEEGAQEYRDRADSDGGRRFLGFGFKGESAEDFASRVGEELDVEGDDVAEAVEQALSDIRTAALEDRLQEAVDSGRITQDRADEILEGLDSDKGHGFGKRGHHGRHGFKVLWGRGHHRGSGDADNPTATPEPDGDEDSS